MNSLWKDDFFHQTLNSSQGFEANFSSLLRRAKESSANPRLSSLIIDSLRKGSTHSIRVLLEFLDYCNCRSDLDIYLHLSSNEFLKELNQKLVDPKFPLELKGKVLNLIQTWRMMFPQGIQGNNALAWYHDELVLKDIPFPPFYNSKYLT